MRAVAAARAQRPRPASGSEGGGQVPLASHVALAVAAALRSSAGGLGAAEAAAGGGWGGPGEGLGMGFVGAGAGNAAARAAGGGGGGLTARLDSTSWPLLMSYLNGQQPLASSTVPQSSVVSAPLQATLQANEELLKSTTTSRTSASGTGDRYGVAAAAARPKNQEPTGVVSPNITPGQEKVWDYMLYLEKGAGSSEALRHRPKTMFNVLHAGAVKHAINRLWTDEKAEHAKLIPGVRKYVYGRTILPASDNARKALETLEAELNKFDEAAEPPQVNAFGVPVKKETPKTADKNAAVPPEKLKLALVQVQTSRRADPKITVFYSPDRGAGAFGQLQGLQGGIPPQLLGKAAGGLNPALLANYAAGGMNTPPEDVGWSVALMAMLQRTDLNLAALPRVGVMISGGWRKNNLEPPSVLPDVEDPRGRLISLRSLQALAGASNPAISEKQDDLLDSPPAGVKLLAFKPMAKLVFEYVRVSGSIWRKLLHFHGSDGAATPPVKPPAAAVLAGMMPLSVNVFWRQATVPMMTFPLNYYSRAENVVDGKINLASSYKHLQVHLAVADKKDEQRLQRLRAHGFTDCSGGVRKFRSILVPGKRHLKCTYFVFNHDYQNYMGASFVLEGVMPVLAGLRLKDHLMLVKVEDRQGFSYSAPVGGEVNYGPQSAADAASATFRDASDERTARRLVRREASKRRK